jgi:superfamily II DNA helicase RecQ
MDRRSIRLDVSIAGKLHLQLEKFFVASIARNRNGKIIIYTNSKVAAETSLKESIESLLKKHKIEGCVMPFTGDNGIMMKNYVMTSFCPDDISCTQDMENIFCVIGTAAMECGVSSKEVTTGISVGMPRSLYDLYQYMGRVDRKHDALPGQVSYSVLLNVPSFLFMYVRALSEPNITMRERQERDLMEVLRFLVLPTKCYHLSMELYLQDQENVANNNHCVEPCNVCCPFCDDSYLDFADKINKTNLTMIL